LETIQIVIYCMVALVVEYLFQGIDYIHFYIDQKKVDIELYIELRL